ncbi:MAG: penicillin acylase family protein [Chloroflexota bacterium]|nr:penicillin acylase family protein [Chloroflexota bacterium]
MRLLRILLLALLVIVVITAVGAFTLYWDTTRGPLPVTVGALEVIGLEAQVEILRDEWGVPHIYAFTPHDLYFAQGYTHAQDRWWQMEFARHVGSGTLGELVGQNDRIFGNDVFIRTAGWRRAAERDLDALNDDTRTQMEAFASGVNAYLRDRTPDDLALEYRILGVTGANITVEPWTLADSLVWGKVMGWLLASSYDQELENQALFTALGEAMVRDYLPPYPYDLETAPTILRPEDLPILDESTVNPLASAPVFDRVYNPRMAGGVAPADRLGGLVRATTADGVGSNNWAVTGTMSASGLALLANDMHLDPSIPSVWYTVGLHCLPVRDECPYDMVGLTFPPIAGIIVGHNADIAWGMTNVGADAQDLYALEWNPENPLQYRWDGAWRDAEVIEETITFADGTPAVTMRVRQTHLGPVLNDNAIDADGALSGYNTVDPLVLRWTGYEPSTLANALQGFARARDWEDFRAAAREFTIPAQNLVFADVRGNIGYQMPGLMPIRPAGRDGLTPQPASSDADLWQGYVPFDDLPRVLNPDREFVFSANQAVVPLSYYESLDIAGNTRFSFGWANGERAHSIETRLNERAPHTVESFKDIQRDNYDLNAARLLPYFASLSLDEGSVREARDYLVGWDARWNGDSGQAALYAHVARALLASLFDDQLPDDYQADVRQLFAAWLLMEDPNNVWWDDAATTDTVEARDDILRRALTQGVNELAAAQGANPADWSWAALHDTQFVSNPLGVSGIDLIESMVNRRADGYDGATTAINSQDWTAPSGSFTITQHPSERLIIDMANFDASLSILPTGQSGHPYSPHYDDMIEPYRLGSYAALVFTRAEVEIRTKERLVLSPPGVE